VQVSFFGGDGSLIGQTTTVELKAGESTSVPASNPSRLVRAIVTMGEGVDLAKVCATSLYEREIATLKTERDGLRAESSDAIRPLTH
jgi:hypothetical protein